MFLNNKKGYSLFEMIIVILIISVLTTITLKSLKTSSDINRVEETKEELLQLAYSIAGNPNLVSAGKRTDFGYVGDVGALPANLDALVQNPGGYTTWNGPYLKDDYYLSAASSESEFKIDAWGTAYTYSGSITISSTGSGSSITQKIANSSNELLLNEISAVITDLNNSPPGTIYKDSLRFILSYPNGTGSTTNQSLTPSQNGFVQYDSIPIGVHTLKIVYIPTADTLTRIMSVIPGQNYYTEIQLNEDLW